MSSLLQSYVAWLREQAQQPCAIVRIQPRTGRREYTLPPGLNSHVLADLEHDYCAELIRDAGGVVTGCRAAPSAIEAFLAQYPIYAGKITESGPSAPGTEGRVAPSPGRVGG